MTIHEPTQQHPILEARFYAPPIPAACVQRLRLTSLLNTGLTVPLTLVSASAGFGKSILVSDWIRTSPDLKFAWLTIEDSDNDWGRFFRYLVTAWQKIFPQVGVTAFQEQSISPSVLHETLIDSLLNDLLIYQGGNQTTLVLDDYHNINNTDIHKMVVYLIEHMPPRCHLVLLTRLDPPLPLARWRSRGNMIEVRTKDLRFTGEEAAEFLKTCMHLDLTAEQVQILEGRTEGWIAGLQLAALSLKGRSDIHEFVQSFGGSHRYVLDYLMEEVFNHQPKEIQQFLLTTAPIERFCAPLCDALRGSTTPNSLEILERLEKANLFIISLDDERCWYRYHHLFADLLRVRLKQSDPQRKKELQQCAAIWFAKEHLWQEGIHYAIDSQEYDLAEDIVTQAIRSDGMTFLFSGIHRLIESFPAQTLAASPILCLAKAADMVETSQLDGIEPLLRKAQSELPDDLLGVVYLIESVAASLLGNCDWIMEASQQVLRRLPGQVDAQVHALIQLGNIAFYSGRFSEVHAYWAQALDISLKNRYSYGINCCQDNLGRLFCYQGDLAQAETFFMHALTYLEDHPSPRWLADTRRDFADLLREMNRLDEAHSMMDLSMKTGEQWSPPSSIGLGIIHMGRIYLAEGNILEAEAMLQKAEAICQSHTVYPDLVVITQVFHSQVLIETGRAATALELLDTCLGLDFCQHELHQEWVRIAKARALLRLCRYEETLALLVDKQESAIKNRRGKNWLETTLLIAMAFAARGDETKALDMLQIGLAYAQSNGFVRTILDEGNAMRVLLQKAYRQGDRTATGHFIAKLLADFPPSQINTPDNTLAEPLSEREMQILNLVCQGLSNQEIAVQLVLSVGTVKTHIHHIFGKLGVENRPQAIAATRQLGIESN